MQPQSITNTLPPLFGYDVQDEWPTIDVEVSQEASNHAARSDVSIRDRGRRHILAEEELARKQTLLTGYADIIRGVRWTYQDHTYRTIDHTLTHHTTNGVTTWWLDTLDDTYPLGELSAQGALLLASHLIGSNPTARPKETVWIA